MSRNNQFSLFLLVGLAGADLGFSGGGGGFPKLKTLTKKIAFFGTLPPSKLAYIGAQGAFRKILGSVSQKWISQISTEGGFFGSAWGQIPEGGR